MLLSFSASYPKLNIEAPLSLVPKFTPAVRGRKSPSWALFVLTAEGDGIL